MDDTLDEGLLKYILSYQRGSIVPPGAQRLKLAEERMGAICQDTRLLLPCPFCKKLSQRLLGFGDGKLFCLPLTQYQKVYSWIYSLSDRSRQGGEKFKHSQQ